MTDSREMDERHAGALELQESINAVMRGEAVLNGLALDIVRGASEWAGATEHARVLLAQSMRLSLDPEHDGDNCAYFDGEDFDCWVCRADLAVEHARGLHPDGLHECYACAFGDTAPDPDELAADGDDPLELQPHQ